MTSARTPPRDPSPARERVVISWLRRGRRERERALALCRLERVRMRMEPRWGAGMSVVWRRGVGERVVERLRLRCWVGGGRWWGKRELVRRRVRLWG